MTNLKLMRLQCKFNQTVLAQKTGIHRWKIALAENGRYILDQSDAEIIAAFFKVPVEILQKHAEGFIQKIEVKKSIRYLTWCVSGDTSEHPFYTLVLRPETWSPPLGSVGYERAPWLDPPIKWNPNERK